MRDDPQHVDRSFIERVTALPDPRGTPAPLPHALDEEQAWQLFESQLRSRHVDFAARRLREQNQGFYTIGSAGHEGNAAVAEALRPTDPAFVHYRSGAFFVQRAAQGGYPHAVRDMLLGITASSDEPIAGGRHKVFGSVPLRVPPQTSTIASQLPKAVGMAFSLRRASRLGFLTDCPSDAIVMCSFGDASANHSTATGAINTACYIAYQGLNVPLLLLCEDNGLGISVKTPEGWIRNAYGSRPGLAYFEGDGCALGSAFEAATRAVAYVREHRRPALLRLLTVRLMGHAGSDVALAYRSPDEIRSDLERDPLVSTAKLLVDHGLATPREVLDRYEAVRTEVGAAASEAAARPKLATAHEVMAPLAPRSPDAVEQEAVRGPDVEARAEFWGSASKDSDGGPLSWHVNRALGDLLVKYPQLMLFGEDVGRKGGVYGVTRGLSKRTSVARVHDTLLDEQTILGLAIGAAHAGFLPVAEIQYLAYLHNAEDQLRGEAATLQFFSKAQLANPMVVRIASYGYQKGFGGHFHNDNSIAVLRDIPGLIVASPSRGDDAAAMLRTCVAAAAVDGSVSAFLEPIALYNTRDLFDAGDGELAPTYRFPDAPHVPIGSGRVWGDGKDLLIVSFANGVVMARKAARTLEREHGIRCRVLDLRWLSPLPVADLIREANAVGQVLIVDETRRTGGVSEGVVAALIDEGFRGPIKRVASLDSFIPLGAAANLVLVQQADVEAAALKLLGKG